MEPTEIQTTDYEWPPEFRLWRKDRREDGEGRDWYNSRRLKVRKMIDRFYVPLFFLGRSG